MLKIDADIAIAGAGFAGSLTALILHKLGHRVLLLERSQHPRFAIGESSTPLANLLWAELTTRYDLPTLASFSKWGTWQQAHPEVACGLKRGFSFYHHVFGRDAAPSRDHQLLVAASPRDPIADTHWFRQEFDAFLAREAQRSGVILLENAEVHELVPSAHSVQLQGSDKNAPFAVTAKFLIDASGPRGFLHQHLHLPEAPLSVLPHTTAAFSHFQGVRRWSDLYPPETPPPFPVDDAALHHVFEGGWIWVLRFNNGITSAGAAVTARLSTDLGLDRGAAGWDQLLDQLPAVKKQFEQSAPVQPFRFLPKLGFLSGYVVGERWALLPSAAGFIDPLLSTGFALTLSGVERLTRIFEESWNTSHFESRLLDYSMATTVDLLTVERLVTALYASMRDFDLFAALSLLYFAAVSYTETCWRLGQRHRTGAAFLMSSDPEFGMRMRYCCDQAIRLAANTSTISKAQLIARIHQTIQPIDIAGLSDPTRRNWFDARADDLLNSAAKLGVAPADIQHMLHRTGFLSS